MTASAFRFKFPVRGNLIGGSFQKPTDVSGEWLGRSPADFSEETGRFEYSYSSVEDAVQSARKAFSTWRNQSFEDRAELLRKYQNVIKNREEEIAETISREVGKPLWESRTEVSAMIAKVDITLSESMKFISNFEIPSIMENTRGTCRYKPLGVMAIIGPFNFPGHLPGGQIVASLATGNTVVFKPSEKAPLVGQLLAECFLEAGFPPGVINLVQGEREVGRRLCVHEGITGIIFTGSYEVGARIKQDTLHQHWKLLALEMGGKNSAIVWEDAELDFAVHQTLTGAFLSAGQRCSSTSRIIVSKKILDSFLERFHQRAKAFSIGYPLDNPFMGPLIEQGSVDRYMKFLGIAVREGCELIMRGKSLELPRNGNYVTPSICLVKEPSLDQTRKSVYQQTEIFAPNVAILGAEDLEEAIAQANATQFGLAAGVFTQSREVFEKCWDNLDMGVINWNKATIGASSRLPFGGLKKSGNHFPTALFATTHCVAPVASLEVSEPQAVTSIASQTPGLNWK
jgi:succinylglutamic semialdehyde dehydrogenase